MSKIKIMHWNCFSLTIPRNSELKQFLIDNKPDIFLLQEIKLDNAKANLRLRYEGYATYIKVRDTNPGFGGGVAILINEDIPHSLVENFDTSLELIRLTVEFNRLSVDIMTYYNPPDKTISDDLFTSYIDSGKNFLLLGDLNSKSRTLGCKKTDSNGKILENILLNSDLVVFNDNCPTYNSFSDTSYSEILDLVIGSNSLIGSISNFTVLEENLTSDHNIVSIDLSTNGWNSQSIPYIARFNFAKANWQFFYEILNNLANSKEVDTIKELEINLFNSRVTEIILEAAKKAIPCFKKTKRKSLPSVILKLIHERKRIRKLFKRNKNNPELKRTYNDLTRAIKNEICMYESNKWNNFLGKCGQYPVSNSSFWNKINETKSSKQTSSIPNLTFNGESYKTDTEKAMLFESILAETFSESNNDNDFDASNYSKVENTVDNLNLCDDFSPFNSIEIYRTIKKLNSDTSPGADKIHNIILKNLPYDFIDKILSKLINRAIKFGLPNEWKKACITMIPKKIKTSNPGDYRPISLISCLGKIAERLIRNRLYNFLESNNIIVNQQSGFRDHKGTGDSLFFFTQKNKRGSPEKTQGLCYIL